MDILTGITLGLHLASVHAPAIDGQHNFNPGIYARAENGVTVGAYRNSLGRASVYVGYTLEAGPFALGIGVATGYKRRNVNCVYGEPYLDAGSPTGMSIHWECDVEGSSKHALAPLLQPSVALPAIAGFVPRLSVIPRIGSFTPATVFHLSVERKF